MKTTFTLKSSILRGLLSLFFLVAMVGNAWAVPARSSSFTHQQPDGTVLTLRLVGDEYMHYYLNEKDGTKMKQGEDGHFYAISSEQISEMTASANVRRSEAQQRRMQRLPARSLASGAPNKTIGSFGNMTGNKKGIVILVNFADKKMTTGTQTEFNNMFNQEGYNTDGHIGSVADYFKAQSYNQFNLSFDVVGPVTLSNNMAYYGGNDSSGNDKNPGEMIKEACSAVDGQVNFADYDWSGDGYVDQVFVVYAGYGANYTNSDPDAIWPHEWDLVSAGVGVQTYDGVKVKTYACCAELYGTTSTKLNGIGTACHEFSHCLGYPDSYDTDYSGGIGMDSYDVMCGGSYNGPNGKGEVPVGYTAYERWMAGWLTPMDLSTPANVSNMADLGTAAEAYIIKNPSNSTEYFLLENRQNDSWFKYFDKSEAGHGLFITYVDYSSSVWSNNKPNDDASHQRLTWVPADGNYGTYDSESKAWSVTNANHKGDFFPGTGNVTSFTNASHTGVYGKWNTGTSNNFKSITDITESNGKISFKFDGGDNGTRYTVTFNAGSGTCSTSSLSQTSYGGSVTLPTATFSTTEWTFAGWSASSVSQTTTQPTILTAGSDYTPTDNVTLYAVYTKTESAGASGSYALDYNAESGLQSTTLGYGNAVEYTATDGGKWVIKAYKSSGMQINNKKNASIKVPDCPSNISSIVVTDATARVLKFSETDYTGSNTPTVAASSSSSTTATIDLSGKGLTTGYIYTTDGSTSITKIVVNYGSGSTTYYATSPSLIVIPTPTIAFTETNASGKSMLVGDTYKNAATASCAGVNLPAVSYTSSKTDVATVDESGKVTAVAVGTTTITATVEAVEGKSKAAWTSYAITVTMPELSSIAITTPPTKTAYTEGDTFSADGMVVKATYANDYSREVTGYTCSPTTIGKDDTQVTVSYTEGNVTKTAIVAITVTALPRYKVTFDAGSGTCATESLSAVQQESIVLPTCSISNSDWTFVGWSTAKVTTATATKPTLLKAGDNYKPEADCTLYAVFGKKSGEDKWKRMSASRDLEEGTYALVTSDNKAFNGVITSKKGGVTTDAFNFDSDGLSTSAPDGTCLISLIAVTGGFSMYSADHGYLCADDDASGNLSWRNLETSYWYLSGSKWMFKANSAQLRFYNSQLNTYAESSSNGSVIAFAKLVAASTSSYLSTPNTSPLKSIAVTTPPTKTTYTEGDSFDPTGMVVTATYEDNSTQPVVDYTCTPEIFGGNDDHVTISYTEGGATKTATVSVTVTPLVRYTVTFEAGSGTCTVTSLKEESQGSGVTLPECTPAEGYVFAGWSATSQGTTADAGVAGDVYKPSSDCVLYAVYQKKYTITWSVNGTTSTSTFVEGEAIVFADPEQTNVNGKSFMGWVASPIEGTTDTAPAFVTEATASQNMTYYAVFATVTTSELQTASLSTNFSNPSAGWTVNQSGGTSYWKIFSGNSITSPSFDLSTLQSVVVQMGTFGNGTHSLDIKANGTELWANQAPASSTESTSYTIESETALTGNGTLVFTSTNSSTSAGLRIKSIKINYQTGTTSYSEYCTTVATPKTLQSITVSGTPSDFNVGDEFNHEGMTVTATWSEGDPTDVTSQATFTTPDMTTAGQKTVTVTFKGKTATYDITVKEVVVVKHYAIFSVNGDTTRVAYAEGASIVFPQTATAPEGKVFCGWYGSTYSNATTAPTYVTSATMGIQDVTYYAVFATQSNGNTEWKQVTALANINAGTYVIINGGFVLPNTKTSSAPAAVTAPTVSDGKITGNVTSAMEWTFSSTGTDNQFYIQNSGNNYLYEINNNNGLKVGTTSDSWTFAVNTTGFFSLKGSNNNRYCAKYSGGSDWRSYNTATAGNYANGGKIELYKKTSGASYSDYCTSVVVKSLASIAVTGTPAEFWMGDTFNHNGMTVTATWSEGDPTDVTSKASFSTPDMSTAGEKTVTVTYSGKTATYTINVKTIANTQETAYTTAEAIAKYKAGKDLSTKVYVKGTISQVDKFDETDKYITYWLDDNAFEIFKGKAANGADFASIDDIKVNGTVVVYGTLSTFGSTYELAEGSWLTSYTAPAVSKNTATLTLGTYKKALTTGVDDEFTVTYNGDGTVEVTSSDETVAEAIIVDGTVLVSAKKAGTTTITVSAAETENYTAVSKYYTLTVSDPIPAAELPFSFDGGRGDIAANTGMSYSGIGTDYTSSPKLKFDSQGDNVIINYASSARNVTYKLKGNSMSGTYAFDVMESADGTTYTTVHSHNSIGEATSFTDKLKSDSRYVKFVYTKRSSGNVALGAISISNEKADPGLAFEQATYRFFTDESKTIAAASSKGSTGAITYALTTGDESAFSITNTGVITCTTAGTYTVTATIAETEDYKSATATCTIQVKAPVVANSIIVAATDDGKYFAMTNTAGDKYITSVQIAKVGDKFAVTGETLDAIKYATETADGKTTIVAMNGQYLQATEAKNVSFNDDEYQWTNDGEKLTAATSSYGTLQYNVSSPRFTTYTNKSGQYATIVGLDNVSIDYSRTMSLTEGQTKWGTICLPYAVAAEDRSGAEYYSILGVSKSGEDITGIVLGKEEGALVAGKPYLFKATADLYCPYSGSPASAPVEATGLVGNFSGNAQVPANCYILSSNKIRMVLEGATAYVGPNRAYLDLAGVAEYTEGSEANAIRFGFDGQVEDYTTYIQSVQYNAEDSVLIFDLQGHKVQTMKPGQLYIVNGKKMFNK